MKFNEQVGTTIGATIIVVIAITVGAFVWVYERGQREMMIPSFRPSSTKISEDETPSPTNPTKTPGQLSFIEESNYLRALTESWETCENRTSGFGIKYPKNWNVFTENSGVLIKSDCNNSTLVFSPDNSTSSDTKLRIEYIGDDRDIQEYMKENPSIFESDPTLQNNEPGLFGFNSGQAKLSVVMDTGSSPTQYISRGKEIFLLNGSGLPDYYFTAFIYGLSFPTLNADQDVSHWKSCTNAAYGYEIKYPSTWSVQTGDIIQGIRVMKDCSNSSMLHRVTFTSLDPQYSRQIDTGITITVERTMERGSFKRVAKETEIDGEKVEWISRNFGRFYHKDLHFTIEVQNDVSDETLDSFLRTFRFLS